MSYKRTENRGRPSEKPAVVIKKFTREYDDSIWYYNLDKFANGPYLVEIIDPKFDKIEKLYNKLEKLQTPKFHENGRKKRTTKADKNKITTTEKLYWNEHYRLFPEDKPKKRGRKKKK
jgi:hypothetical protein